MTFEKLVEIFVPEDFERRGALSEGQRLVHYTSAEAAYRIITGKQVWLRNALLMNDFSEIQYGLNCLQTAWVAPVGQQLQEWLDRVIPGFKDQLVSLFDAHISSNDLLVIRNRSSATVKAVIIRCTSRVSIAAIFALPPGAGRAGYSYAFPITKARDLAPMAICLRLAVPGVNPVTSDASRGPA